MLKCCSSLIVTRLNVKEEHRILSIACKKAVLPANAGRTKDVVIKSQNPLRTKGYCHTPKKRVRAEDIFVSASRIQITNARRSLLHHEQVGKREVFGCGSKRIPAGIVGVQ